MTEHDKPNEGCCTCWEPTEDVYVPAYPNSDECPVHRTPPPTSAPEPPQAIAVMKQFDHFVQFYAEREMTSPSNGQEAVSDMREMLRQWDAVLAARPHRIGVYDYQSLCDCLRHNLEQAIPGYAYRDPQDAIQTLAARVMTLQTRCENLTKWRGDSEEEMAKVGIRVNDDGTLTNVWREPARAPASTAELDKLDGDMFWDDEDMEQSHSDPDEILADYGRFEIAMIQRAQSLIAIFGVRDAEDCHYFNTAEEAEAWVAKTKK